jgi:AcrR family transcriptional regulator
MADGLADRIDGRVARSHRTRRAIVDALRALHVDGDLRPTAPRVAERAGVSLRTVWQHFQDLETLFFEAGRRDLEIAGLFVDPIDQDLPREQRVAEVAEQRARMFEAMAPVWRAARLQEPFSPQIQTNRERLLMLGREQLETVFRAELDRRRGRARSRLRTALELTTGWAAWESLRTDLHLDPDEATATMIMLLSRLLAD